jgi:hypothetical protein
MVVQNALYQHLVFRKYVTVSKVRTLWFLSTDIRSTVIREFVCVCKILFLWEKHIEGG